MRRAPQTQTFTLSQPSTLSYSLAHPFQPPVDTKIDFNENRFNHVYENKTFGDSGLPQKKRQLLRISQVYPRVYKFQVQNNPISKQEN